ncbi:MAG TPA: peptide chain release factor N(5)-glutamine methyltransferase [Acetobacteraceae bacterium]
MASEGRPTTAFLTGSNEDVDGRNKPHVHQDNVSSETEFPCAMAGEGRPTTSLPLEARKDVGGRPSPAMTQRYRPLRPPAYPDAHGVKPGPDTTGEDCGRARYSATRSELVHHGAAILRAAGIDNPRLEARLLLAHALGIHADVLIRDPNLPAPTPGYDAMLARRAAHEPLAHILGHREFWSLSFAVSPATLIPRPESETLIEAALAAFTDRPPPGRILDLGTGTGCLLVAALHEFPQSFGIGVDRSLAAAGLAAGNAAALGVADRAAFLCGDWGAALAARFDLILCNPPYIPTSDLDGLMPEVARHEPATALDGGRDGLAAYRRIIPLLPGMLCPDGVAVLELGAGQAEQVAAIATESGTIATTRPDLAGTARALVLMRARG